MNSYYADYNAGTAARRRHRRPRRLQRCPLRQRCTRSHTGKSLKIRPHDALQRAARTDARDPNWLAEYRQHRPMVERSIAWLVRGGNRRVRYRGLAKNDHWLHHRAAALNLRRLINLGLHHNGTTWAMS